MATISVGDAVGEGFLLIRRQPGAVALWALLLVGFLALRIAVAAPGYMALFAHMAQNARSGSSAPPDMTAILPQLQQMQAFGFLLGIASIFLNTVLICGVYRAVLRPEQRGFGYLRVGSAELFLFVFTIGAFFAFLIGAVVVAIPLALIGAIVAHGSTASVGIFTFIAALAVMAGVIYLALRISLVGPMMVDDGQFHLGDAWALTRGKVGSLFLIALLLVVIFIVAEVVTFGVIFSLLVAATGGFSLMSTFFQQPPMAILSRLGPIVLLAGVVWILFISCVLPVFVAPWARAYRDLKHNDVAATFS